MVVAYYFGVPSNSGAARRRRPAGPRLWRNTAVKLKKPVRIRRKSAQPLPDPTLDEYGEGFIDGYLRAHADGEEYGCPVSRAMYAYQAYLSDGGRTLRRTDVEGW